MCIFRSYFKSAVSGKVLTAKVIAMWVLIYAVDV